MLSSLILSLSLFLSPSLPLSFDGKGLEAVLCRL